MRTLATLDFAAKHPIFETARLPAAMADVQRRMLALIGLFKFHSVPLCGRLDSLPRRTTFGFRHALHLLEAARQRCVRERHFPAVPCVAWGKGERGKRTWWRRSDHDLAWLALPSFFSVGSIPCCTAIRNSFTTLDYGSFSSFWRVVWLTSSSRVDSAMRGSSISFLTRASVAWLDSCLGSFLCILARCHESKGITGQLGTELPSFRIIFLPSSFEQSRLVCET